VIRLRVIRWWCVMVVVGMRRLRMRLRGLLLLCVVWRLGLRMLIR
jgi:hypothetical protein